MIDKLIKPVSELLDKFIPDADTKQKIASAYKTFLRGLFGYFLSPSNKKIYS